MIPLRILLINTKVPKNTKLQVANVRKVVDSLPQISENILTAMDQVAIQCLDTLTILSESSANSNRGRKYIDGNKDEANSLPLYQKLEVRTMKYVSVRS